MNPGDFNFHGKKLESLIWIYKKQSSAVSLTALRKNISEEAREVSRRTLALLTQKESHTENKMEIANIESLVQNVFEVLEHPVQLAMVAMHWDPSEHPADVLHSAVDRLQCDVDILEEAARNDEQNIAANSDP